MRRTIPIVVAALVALSLAAGGMGAHAKKRVRKVVADYRSPTVGAGGIVSECNEHDNVGCVDMVALSGERYIRVSIEDDLGTQVYANLAQDVDGDGIQDFIHAFCGEMERAQQIDPMKKVTIHIFEGPGRGALDCPGPSSSGTITGLFSRRP
ncbi:MAG: hypothetical protein ABR575_00960 [Actinomycetota bacterium]